MMSIKKLYLYIISTGEILAKLDEGAKLSGMPETQAQIIADDSDTATNISELTGQEPNIEILKELEATDEGMIRVIEELVDYIEDGAALSSFALAKVAARKAKRAELT